MPAALPKMCLSDFTPTPQELQQAREVLAQAGNKGRKSKTNSMLAWLKDNPCPEATSSRAESREFWLAKFVCMQLAAKTKTSNVSQEFSSSKANMQDVYYWAKEQMIMELGEHKTTAWISSGLLPHRPCSLTGEDTEFLREYTIPINWSRMTADDLRKWSLQSEGAATEEDLKLMAELCPSNGAGSSGDGAEGEAGVLVKQEPKEPLSKEESAKKELDIFMAGVDSHIENTLQMELAAKKMIGNRDFLDTKHQKYTEGLADDLTAHATVLGRLQTVLKKCLSKKPDTSKVPCLLAHISSLQETHAQLVTVASKFGLAKVGTKRRAKGKATA